MVRESFAACVQRHTAALDQLILDLVAEPDAKIRGKLASAAFRSLAEMERMADLRIERSEKELQRRDGADLARTAASAVGFRG